VAVPGSPPAALDPRRVQSWAADKGLGSGPWQVEPLGQGHSNLTFLVRGAGGELVARRPPLGPLQPTAHDVLREAAVLARLGAGPVPVPTVLATCEDPSVVGAPFFLMTKVDGVVLRGALPRPLADRPAAQRALGLDVADVLARIHGVDPAPFLAAGLGRPDGYLARQLSRWTAQRSGLVDAVARAGGTARALPDSDALARWLTAHCPDEIAPTLVHGDFKLDNLLIADVATAVPRVAAVLDWEMATVGDPRADLGYLLALWPQPGEPAALPGGDAPAVLALPRAELAARWAARTGCDPEPLDWFQALALWKLATLLEVSYHRWLAGRSDDAMFASLESGVPALLARGREVAGA